MHTIFPIVGIILPIIIQPFLSKSIINNTNKSLPNLNNSKINLNIHDNYSSKIHLPFMFIGIFSIFLSIVCLIIILKQSSNILIKEYNNSVTNYNMDKKELLKVID